MSISWTDIFEVAATISKYGLFFGLFFSGRQYYDIIYTNKRLPFALRKNNIARGFRLTGSRVDCRIVIYYCYMGVVTLWDYSLSHFPRLTSNTLHVAVIYVGTYNLLHNGHNDIFTIFSPLKQYNNCII